VLPKPLAGVEGSLCGGKKTEKVNEEREAGRGENNPKLDSWLWPRLM